MIPRCKKCGYSLEKCAGVFPYYEEYLICSNCDSTYLI